MKIARWLLRAASLALPLLGFFAALTVLMTVALISREPNPTAENLVAVVFGWLSAALGKLSDTLADLRVLAAIAFAAIWGTLRSILGTLRYISARLDDDRRERDRERYGNNWP